MRKRTFLYFLKDKAIPSPSGCRYVKQHTVKREGNNLTLVETGVLDTQEMIESYVDGVSLEKMIQRFRRGDESAFMRKQAFYADVSGMPTDMLSVINTGRAASAILADQEAAPASDPAAESAAEPVADNTAE